jgi:hypothetical protein
MSKPSDKDERRIERRSFLRGVGVGAGAAGVAAVSLAAGPSTQPAKASQGKARAGYRETEHVRRVYELARF